MHFHLIYAPTVPYYENENKKKSIVFSSLLHIFPDTKNIQSE